jgi:hypothetical protein
MPGPLYHQGNVTICPHGGQVNDIPTTPRVTVSFLPVAVLGDVCPIVGCAFVLPSGTPHPCVLTNFVTPALRVFILGRPALLQTSVGLCVAPDQAPQGPPGVLVNQPRVIAT